MFSCFQKTVWLFHSYLNFVLIKRIGKVYAHSWFFNFMSNQSLIKFITMFTEYLECFIVSRHVNYIIERYIRYLIYLYMYCSDVYLMYLYCSDVYLMYMYCSDVYLMYLYCSDVYLAYLYCSNQFFSKHTMLPTCNLKY